MAASKTESTEEGSEAGPAASAASGERVPFSGGRPLGGFRPFSTSSLSDFFVNLADGVVFAVVSMPTIAKIIKMAQSQENIHIFEAGRKIQWKYIHILHEIQMKTLIGINIYLSERNTYIYMNHKNEQYVKYLKFYVLLYKCVLESQQNILFTQKTYYKEHLLQFSFLVVFLVLHVLKFCSQSFKLSCQRANMIYNKCNMT